MNTFEIEYFLQLSKTFMKNQQKMLEPLLQLLKVSVSIELNNTLDADESIAPWLFVKTNLRQRTLALIRPGFGQELMCTATLQLQSVNGIMMMTMMKMIIIINSRSSINIFLVYCITLIISSGKYLQCKYLLKSKTIPHVLDKIYDLSKLLETNDNQFRFQNSSRYSKII